VKYDINPFDRGQQAIIVLNVAEEYPGAGCFQMTGIGRFAGKHAHFVTLLNQTFYEMAPYKSCRSGNQSYSHIASSKKNISDKLAVYLLGGKGHMSL
jgi:hypothetical protein